MKKIDGIFGFIIAVTAILAIAGCAGEGEPIEASYKASTETTAAETITIITMPAETEAPTTAPTEPPIPLYGGVPLEEELQKQIIAYCEYRNIDPAIVFAIASLESNFDPGAIGDSGNSLGLMQIQPRWHSERMKKLGCQDLFDPLQSVMVGVDYLCEMTAYYGDMAKALVAYNQGQYEGTITSYANSILYIAQQLRETIYLEEVAG